MVPDTTNGAPDIPDDAPDVDAIDAPTPGNTPNSVVDAPLGSADIFDFADTPDPSDVDSATCNFRGERCLETLSTGLVITGTRSRF